jgi:hypothetical protein
VIAAARQWKQQRNSQIKSAKTFVETNELARYHPQARRVLGARMRRHTMPQSPPPDAGAESQIRYALATKLAAQCPPGLAQAIAITGSVSRGYADRFSDIELLFLSDSPLPVGAYEDWLRSVGGRIEPEEMAWHGGSLTKSWHEGIFVEGAWQPYTALDERLERIMRADTIDHWDLSEAWHIHDALILRDDGRLAAQQERLKTYPSALAERLVAAATEAWSDPHWWPVSLVNVWPVAERGLRMELAGRLEWIVSDGLRVLFALNKRWEPDYKWLEGESRKLRRAPDQLAARVNAIFSQAQARASVSMCLDLLDDILALAATEYDVTLVRERLNEIRDPDNLPKARGAPAGAMGDGH